VGDACDGGGQCLAGTPVVCDHYVTYKAGAAAFDDPGLAKFPSDWNLSLDDVQLVNTPPALFPDDPENYVVKKERSLVNPAGKNDEPGPFKPELHYVRYQITRGRQGVGDDAPPGSGSFPKAVKAPKRLWHVENQFGDIVVRTKKVRALWIPAGKAEAPALADDPGDATHYLCYQAKASKIPSAQEPDTSGNGRGKFRKDIEHYFLDQFGDCAVFKDGVTVPFPGTPVEGACLYVMKKPMELCSPADKSAVVPPRLTAATIDGSTAAVRGEGLLCYKAKLVSRVRNATAAALGGVAPGDGLRQRPHTKRRLKDGTNLNVVPGNQFPAMAMDTTKAEFVCVPTTVLSVTDL
jgi:hypothetical protein